ncbi:hypothetical protein RJ55_02366 [Drechmeria coniospora]|nr:hypothetical protein RJ55_02366 [Drechmeria coniospora]
MWSESGSTASLKGTTFAGFEDDEQRLGQTILPFIPPLALPCSNLVPTSTGIAAARTTSRTENAFPTRPFRLDPGISPRRRCALRARRFPGGGDDGGEEVGAKAWQDTDYISRVQKKLCRLHRRVAFCLEWRAGWRDEEN